MQPKFYYLNEKKVITTRPTSIIHGIGKEKYEEWKGVKLFHVHDSLTAADFIIHVLSTMRPFDIYQWHMLEELTHHYGISTFFMGTIYCINRGIEVNVFKGDFAASLEDQYDPFNGMCGFGASPLMAIVELNYEMKIENVKSFIP